MATANARRLERLEMKNGQADEYSHLTADEISLLLLTNMLEMKSKGAEQYNLRIEAIKADIVSTAAKQKSQEYQDHLEWCQKMWAARGKDAPFVPAVTGGGWGEYQDWDIPGVMQRRSELRESQLVQDALRRTLQ